MIRSGAISALIVCLALSPAMGRATTAGGAVQGTLFAPGGAAVTSNNVNFKVQVLDKNGTCVLYEESHLGVDLSNTNGDFSFDLGSGTSRTNFVKSTTVLDTSVFKNDANLPAFSGCASGVTLAAGDDRLLRVQFDVGSGYARLEPDMHMMGGVYSAVAETVQGKGAADLVQIKNTGSVVLTQTNAEDIFSSVNFPKLQALLAGSSSLYLPTGGTSPVNINGNRLINVGTPTAPTDAATKGYADTTIGGKNIDVTAVGAGIGGGSTLLWDQATSKWVAGTMSGVTPGGAAGGDLTGTYPNPTIKSDAITTAKIKSSGGGVNRLLITDASTGTTITFAACSTNEVMKWTASGWACSSVGALAPVTTVAGKTGAVTLNAADVSGLGTVVTKDYGTGSGQVPVLDGTGRLPASNLPTNVLLNGGNTYLANVGIGTTTPQGGLDIATTGTLASALIVPRDTTANRPVSTAVNGMLRYNTNLNIMEAYENGAWKQMIGGAAGSSALSGLTAATATNAIDSLSYAQTWNWSTATAQSPLTVNANALTTGSLLTLATTNASVNSTNGLLNVANTGASTSGTVFRAQSNSTAGSGLTVLANGNVGVGTAAPTGSFQISKAGYNQFLFESTSGTQGTELDFSSYGTGAQSILMLSGARGSKASPAASLSGDVLGYIGAGPSGSVNQSARIRFSATQNWTGSSSPGDIQFQTTPPNQVVPVARMTIDNYGLVGIGTDTPLAGLDVATTGTLASALIVPRDTGSNRPTVAVNGMIRYNISINAFEGYANGAWTNLATSGTSSAQWTTGAGNQIFYNSGSVGIGTINPQGILDVAATGTLASAIIVPRDTTAGRPAGNAVNGMIRYNTNLNIMEAYENGSWKQMIGQIASGATGLFGDGTVSAPSISFSSDSDTGMYHPSANNLALVTGGTARATIDQYGRVGIGTTLPGVSLEVGSLGLRVTGSVVESVQGFDRADLGTAVGTPRLILEDGAVARVWEVINDVGDLALVSQGTAGGDISFRPGGTERMRLLNGGKLGIGTATPGAFLDVYGTGVSSAIIVPRDTTANRPTTTVNGMIRYNSNLNIMEAFENGSWKQMIGASSGSTSFPLLASPSTSAPGAPSYSFTGSTDSGFYSPAASTLAMSVGGIERLRIDSTGDISMFKNDPIANGNDGHAMSVWRNNGGANISTYIDQYNNGQIQGNNTGHLVIENWTYTGHLDLNPNAQSSVDLFALSSAGSTQSLNIYGYRTGDAARALSISVGTAAANTANISGIGTYAFDGTIQSTSGGMKFPDGSVQTTAALGASATLIVAEEQPSGTAAQSSPGTRTYFTRILNTVKLNTISGASLSSDQITLPAGSYIVHANAPAKGCKIKLYNVTSSTDAIIGTFAGVTTSVGYASIVGAVTIASPAVFQIMQSCSNSGNTQGTTYAAPGEVEVYTTVEVNKVN